MNPLLKISIAFGFILLAACLNQEATPEVEKKEPETLVYTNYSDTTELFVEFPSLIVGEESSFAAHFSKLSDFLPVGKGRVTVTIYGDNQPTEEFTVDTTVIDGIFVPKAKPQFAGKRQLTISLQSETLNVSHDLGEVTVYPTIEAAPKETEEEEEHHDDISFLKEQQWKVDFATAIIEEHELQNSITAFASLKAAHQHAYLTAPASGHLFTAASKLPKVGDKVKQGQILGSLSPRLSGSTDIAELKLAVENANTRYQYAKNEQQRLNKLVKEAGIAKSRLTTAKTATKLAKAQLNTARKQLRQVSKQSSSSGIQLYAPISGTIAEVHVASGNYLEEGEELFYIINTGHLWLDAQIAETEISQLKQPERLSFTPNGFENPIQIKLGDNGKLISYGQLINPVSRTLPLVVEFDNHQTKLPLGLQVKVRIYSGKKINHLAIPETAIVDDNGVNVAFVQEDGETFERRVLRLGLRDNGYIQVLSGLDKDERLVTTGAYLVHLASSSPSAEHGHAH
ncbi:MAG: efflux RND transporter periplasmic adaptor subunit [Methylococcaceae bacterium]|nr:efflux RND transporter periplasmic adaptor subunit [Methylococcaceae bacterium]